jgi:hypothetical protein
MHRVPSTTIQGVGADQLEEGVYAEVEEGGGAQPLEMQDVPPCQQEVAVIEVAAGEESV